MHAAPLADRIRGEFIEMPGLQLTMKQAARLWGMEQTTCRAVIDALVAAAAKDPKEAERLLGGADALQYGFRAWHGERLLAEGRAAVMQRAAGIASGLPSALPSGP